MHVFLSCLCVCNDNVWMNCMLGIVCECELGVSGECTIEKSLGVINDDVTKINRNLSTFLGPINRRE